MNLIPLEGRLNPPPQPEFVCTACDRPPGHEGEPAPANCLPDPSVCGGVELGIDETESGPFAETTLYTVTLWVLDDWTRWTGVLEVLYQGGVPDVARLCLLPTTDFLNSCDSGGPICADGGTLEVDASGERLHGAGTAFFGPFGFSGPDAPPEFAGMQVDFRF